MAGTKRFEAALGAWMEIPARMDLVIADLGERELDWRTADPGLSIREVVHHLVEANLIASNIVIAALATNGATFDWSWVHPNADWMKRMGYDRAPVRPAIAALRALGEHLSNVICSTADGPLRSVRLLDAPGAPLYSKSVVEILEHEVAHAQEHLGEALRARTEHGR